MNFIQRLKNLFGKKESVGTQQTNHRPLPSDPDFDIHVWLAESRKIRERHSEEIDPIFPAPSALRLGISCCGTQQEMAEQEHRFAKTQRQEEQEEEAKQSPAKTQRRAS